MSTQITWLPDWFALIWRICIFAASIVVGLKLGLAGWRASTNHEPPKIILGRAALFVFVMQAAVANAVLMTRDVTYLGAPAQTVALVLSWLTMRAPSANGET